MMRPTRANKPNGYLLGSYRIATGVLKEFAAKGSRTSITHYRGLPGDGERPLGSGGVSFKHPVPSPMNYLLPCSSAWAFAASTACSSACSACARAVCA